MYALLSLDIKYEELHFYKKQYYVSFTAERTRKPELRVELR
jgi:hypothetical protein